MKEISYWCMILGIVVILIIHLVLKEYGIIEGLRQGAGTDIYLTQVDMTTEILQDERDEPENVVIEEDTNSIPSQGGSSQVVLERDIGDAPTSESTIEQTPAEETSTSTPEPSPIDCVGSWGDWSDCSETCGGGQKTREYSVTTPSENGGEECSNQDGDTETGSCNRQACPVNCQGSWGNWSFCSKKYGDGRKFREYTITTPAANGGQACPYTNHRLEDTNCKENNLTSGVERTVQNIQNSVRYGAYKVQREPAEIRSMGGVGWGNINGRLKQVDIDGNTVCGVNSSDDIFCKGNLTGGVWTRLPGKLKHVSVSNGKLYGVNSADKIYYKANTSSSGHWQNIPGKLKQVDIDGNTVCGVNSADKIYCKGNLTGGNWTNIPGRLKHVSVSNGKLYGVNSSNQTFYKSNTNNTNDWQHIAKTLKQVDIDGNKVCGVNPQNEIFCKNNLTGGNWTNIPGKLKYVSVSNGKLYGANPFDHIFYRANTNP